jgi:N-acetylglucosaminyldiphosphoundecaprenol N-acetyl-beta-D-mannosaminyltransferase
MTGTLDRLDELVQLGRKHGRTHQVATVNVDFLVNALRDPHVHALLQRADLNLADGMPVVWASRLLGTPLPERVAGSDLMSHLAKASATRGWRIHLFGAGAGVADAARSAMLTLHPGATITADSGPTSVDTDDVDQKVAASIRAVDPDVLCVALGNPKQERFIATYREAIACPVMIGVGGSLDMMVGVRRRAPEWMQRSGTEWIYRAAQEPSRLGRRYLHDIRVFGPALVEYWRRTRPYRATAVRAALPPDLSGTPSPGSSPPAESDVVRLDFTGVERLDPRSHASVIGLLRNRRLHGVPVSVTGVDGQLRACLDAYGTWPLVAEHHAGRGAHATPP